MKKLVTGMVIGAIAMGLTGWVMMPKQMIKERKSPMSFDDTLATLQQNIIAGGWNISGTMRLDKSLEKEGHSAPRTAVIKLCHPDHAEAILNSDADHFLSVMMPCSIAVYEKNDGSVFVSTLNAKLMGTMFGGITADVMAGPVARETGAFTAFLN